MPIDLARGMGAELVIAVDLVQSKTKSNISNAFDVIIQTINIVESELFRRRRDQGDVLIRPEVSHISPSSFKAIDELIELGITVARQAIPQIKELLLS